MLCVSKSLSATRHWMGTLTGGDDVHAALARVARENGVRCAICWLLGGVTEVEFRRKNFLTGETAGPVRITAPCEIVGGHATITPGDGPEPSVHMHWVVSFDDPAAPRGVATLGGHVNQARAFAIEFVMHEIGDLDARRVMNADARMAIWSL